MFIEGALSVLCLLIDIVIELSRANGQHLLTRSIKTVVLWNSNSTNKGEKLPCAGQLLLYI